MCRGWARGPQKESLQAHITAAHRGGFNTLLHLVCHDRLKKTPDQFTWMCFAVQLSIESILNILVSEHLNHASRSALEGDIEAKFEWGPRMATAVSSKLLFRA